MPDLIYNVKFNIDAPTTGGIGVIEQQAETAGQALEEAGLSGSVMGEKVSKGAQRASKSLSLTSEQGENLSQSLRIVGGSASSLGNQFKKTTTSSTRMNASFSTANQALFSMSDGLQDATQFSQGFSTGMRAIGNNVGFTVELMANLSRRVQEYNEANQEAIASGQLQAKTVRGELAQSFRGAAGALIFLNIAVAAFTIVSQVAEKRVKKFREQAKELTKVLVEVNSEFAQIDTQIPDPFGFRQRTVELGLLKDAFGDTSEEIEKEFLTSVNAAQGATGNLAANLATTFAQLGFTRSFSIALSEAIGTMSKETFVSIAAFRELAIEIEKQQAVQDAYTKFINQEGNEAIKQYVETARLLSFELSRQSVNADLSIDSQIGLTSSMQSTLELMDDLETQIDNQAKVVEQLIASEGGLTEELIKQMGLLVSLQNLYKAVADPIESARNQIDRMNDSIISQRGGFAAIDVQLANNLELLDELRKKYPELTEEIYAAQYAQVLFANAQKSAVGAEAVSQVAQAANQFGQIFGASKEFSIAMAVVDGGAAIVKTFSQLGFPAGIPAALAVAAKTAQTINQMRQVQPGDSTPVGGSGSGDGATSAGQFGFQMNKIEGQQTFRTPAFTPSNESSRGKEKVDVRIMADRKQLYAMVKQGEEEYRQIKV